MKKPDIPKRFDAINMLAIVLKKFGGTENFSFENIETPVLKEGTVKIRIYATAFNPIDYQMRRGSAESKLLKSVILGREMSGKIVEVHPSVDSFKIGDEVFGYVGNLGSNGTYAEYIVVPETIIEHKPKDLTYSQSAAVALVGLTALQTLEKCCITQNDSVFITGGAGGVGSMLIRLLLEKGFRKIYTTAGNEKSREKIISYGLPQKNILDYRSEKIREKINILTSGEKFDFCLDTVGYQMSELCAEILKINAVYADITHLSTEKARALLFDKGVTIKNISTYAYSLDGDKQTIGFYKSRLSMLKEYFEKNSLSATSVNLVGNFSVETVQKAHEILENNKSKGEKLVMVITD